MGGSLAPPGRPVVAHGTDRPKKVHGMAEDLDPEGDSSFLCVTGTGLCPPQPTDASQGDSAARSAAGVAPACGRVPA